MKTSSAKELYPKGWGTSEDWPWPGYTPIINALGEVVCRVEIPDCGGYHGDTQVLLHDKVSGRYGYFLFGWGSCSGCDALLRCKSYEEVDELIDSISQSIRWFDDETEALRFFTEHDFTTDPSHSEAFVGFCREYFMEKGGGRCCSQP